MANASSSPILFYGEYPHTLDPKNRVTVPAKWRAAVLESSELFIIVPHLEKDCLFVMPPQEFHSIAAKVENSEKLSAESKSAFIAEWYPSARDCAIDKQGRVLLADEHCKQKNLRGEIVLVGSRGRIEIWSKEARAKTRADRAPLVASAYAEAGLL